jgi:hypothetical protein
VRSDSPLQALTLLNDTAFIETARALAKRILREGGGTDQARIQYGFLAAIGRRPTTPEADRLVRFLSLERDEFQTDRQSAALLIGGGGDPRAIREAELAAGGQAAGTQSPEGRAAAERSVARGKIEVAAAKADALERAGEIVAMDGKQVAETAAWTALSRVLLNLDDFINRN